MRYRVVVTVLISTALSLAVGYLLFASKSEAKKAGYVDIIQVFESFDLKKNLQQKMENTLSKDQFVLDSLNIALQGVYKDETLEGNLRFAKIKEMQNNLDAYKYQVSQKESALANQYDTQIWTQLNQYVKQFGEVQELDFMFGANGQGTVLYAKDAYNLTDACIEFVNQKYAGIE